MADQSPFTPQMQSLIEQLLGSHVDRSNRTTPIHQAAMAMAARMAPGYAQSAVGSGGGGTSSGLGGLTPPVSSGGGPGIGGTTGGGGTSSGLGGLTPPVSSGGGPGIGGTTMAAFAAALLKNGGNNPLMQALKHLLSGGAPGTSAAADPFGDGSFSTNGNGVPVGGAPSRSGGMSGIPGYFQNPDGSLVQIPGDPANSGGYGGGLFPVGNSDVDNPDEPHD